MKKRKSVRELIMKRVLAFLILVITIFVMVSCESVGSNGGKSVTIPDISGLDEQTAKTLLASKGLIPKVEYAFDTANSVEKGYVIKVKPAIGESVTEDEIVTIVVSKGFSYYTLSNAVGYMMNIKNIDAFKWDNETEDGKSGTKGFYTAYTKEGFLYIPMYLGCKSEYSIRFMSFGTASINDTFDKTVPIEVQYENEDVPNDGTLTFFTVKIPLEDLGVQRPTNVYVKFDFWVGTTRETFESGFDLSW